jgi:hypothetical protein
VKQVTRSRCVSHANLPPSILWRNRQTEAHLILSPKPRNCRGDFKLQIIKPQLPVLRCKPRNPSTLVFRPNQEIRAHCLLVHGADHTQCHPTSRSIDHRVPDMWLIISGPLHQISYSCHDPCRLPPCRTCHLHTMRQANVILYTKKCISVKSWKCPEFEFKARQVNDLSHIKLKNWPLNFSETVNQFHAISWSFNNLGWSGADWWWTEVFMHLRLPFSI